MSLQREACRAGNWQKGLKYIYLVLKSVSSEKCCLSSVVGSLMMCFIKIMLEHPFVRAGLSAFCTQDCGRQPANYSFLKTPY